MEANDERRSATMADVWRTYLLCQDGLRARINERMPRKAEIDLTEDDYMMQAVHLLIERCMTTTVEVRSLSRLLYKQALRLAFAHISERDRYFCDPFEGHLRLHEEHAEGPSADLEPKTTYRDMEGVEKRIYETRRKRDYRARIRRQKDGE